MSLNSGYFSGLVAKGPDFRTSKNDWRSVTIVVQCVLETWMDREGTWHKKLGQFEFAVDAKAGKEPQEFNQLSAVQVSDWVRLEYHLDQVNYTSKQDGQPRSFNKLIVDNVITHEKATASGEFAPAPTDTPF